VFNSTEDSVWTTLSDLSQQLHQDPSIVSPFGLFVINNDFFGSIVTGVMSYHIILLQFYASSK